MKKIILFAAFFAVPVLLVSHPSEAKQQVNISKKDCRRLAKHSPSGDVAYKPGVDVRGKKVRGADIGGGSPIKIPNVISFSIDKDLSAYGGNSETSMGDVKFDIMSGKLTYNGQPLGGGVESELAAKCSQLLKGGR